MARHDPAIRIVGIDHDRELDIAQAGQVGDLRHLMPDMSGGADMLRIGRAQHRGATGPHQRGDLRQQDLGAGRRHHMGRRGSPIGPRRNGGQPVERSRLGQPGEQVGAQLRDRIRIGIDPGRQVDERFRGAREQKPRGAEIAAMLDRRRIR